ncbi:hypothetical protein C8R46DRAFT_31047 [Mycena filopes]|nr:hypothetical protein C8R46DRAFT_31047 [Mycena filopes]
MPDDRDLEGLSGPMPLLRSLLVKLQYLNHSTGLSWLDAPLLRSATLDDVAADTILLPWSQLTSLTLDRVFPRECTPVLRQTPYLIYCSLALMDEGRGDAGAQVSLSHLESLTMLELDEDYPVTGFLETFLVPALSALEVPESFLGVDPISRLRAFIQNSGCKLQNVVITVTGDDVAFINSYQSAFPSIPNFSFRRYRGDESSSYVELLPG